MIIWQFCPISNNIITEKQDSVDESGLAKDNRKNMVVLYDDGDNSDEILKITNWFANTGNFNLNVVSIIRKGITDNDENIMSHQITL